MPYTDEQYERYCETVANDIAYDSSVEDLASAKHFFASIHMKITDYEITWGWGRSWITVGFDSDIPTYSLWVPDELPEGNSDGLFIAEGCAERWREHKSELESLASVTSDILDKMNAAEHYSDEYYSLEAMAWDANDALIAKWEEIAQEIADIVADEIQSECESVYEREYFEDFADANNWFVEGSVYKYASKKNAGVSLDRVKAYRKRAASKLTKGKVSNKRKYAAMYSDFDNFDELKNDGRYGYLAEMLIDEYDEGEWQNNAICVYDSVEDFAEYELYDGWYAYMIERADYNGAPDPFDYIDMTAFGNALTSSFDESLYCELDGHVVETTYGW